MFPPRSSRATGTPWSSPGSRSPEAVWSASPPRSAISRERRCARWIAERLCGLARVLRGYSQVGLENIALWHERDISHSGAERVVLPDATIALDYMHHIATRIVEGMTVHTDRMRENIELTHGALFSQRALTALVESGMTRDDAYRVVQESAQRAWDEGTSRYPGRSRSSYS